MAGRSLDQCRAVGSAVTGASMVVPLFVTMVVSYFAQQRFSSHYILAFFASLLEQFCLLVTLPNDQLQQSMPFVNIPQELNFISIQVHTSAYYPAVDFCALLPYSCCFFKLHSLGYGIPWVAWSSHIKYVHMPIAVYKRRSFSTCVQVYQ